MATPTRYILGRPGSKRVMALSAVVAPVRAHVVSPPPVARQPQNLSKLDVALDDGDAVSFVLHGVESIGAR